MPVATPLAPPRIDDDATRRQFLIGGAGILLVAAACGNDRPDDRRDSEPAVTIEHKFGTTRIPGIPQRVVTVGLSEQDPVLALGVTPVAVRDWYGDYRYATWPWAQDELGDARPEVLPADALDFERIAALRPDLIVGTYSGITENDYRTLSQIGPTLAQSGEYADYAMPWQEQTRMIGRALGRSDRAEQLIAGVEARFTEARAAHPEFDGATALLAQEGESGEYDVLSSTSARGSFLTSLGFVVPDEVAALIGAGGEEFAAVSAEQVGLLDADVLVWQAGGESGPAFVAQLQAAPLYQRLDVVREGRDVFVTDKGAAGALTWSTVLSIPFALDRLVPKLAAAIDGDPTTEVPS